MGAIDWGEIATKVVLAVGGWAAAWVLKMRRDVNAAHAKIRKLEARCARFEAGVAEPNALDQRDNNAGATSLPSGRDLD